MGKRSVKADKNIYQQYREALALTRAEASELLEIISESRISRIESGDFKPYPDEILIMADKYQKPELCNYYCTKECSIGERHIPEIQDMSLSEITVAILGNLQALEKTKNRLIDITIDGTIDESEMSDFDLASPCCCTKNSPGH